MSEYINIINSKIIEAEIPIMENNQIFTLFMSFSFMMTLLSAFVVWLISSFLFHLFAILFGGVANFKEILKFSALCYILPAIIFLIAIVLVESTTFPKENLDFFFSSTKSLVLIKWLIYISSSFCFIALIPIIKYLYLISWYRALLSIIIPLGSIYLLGQFFSNYIF